MRLSELSRLGGHLQTSMNAITLAQNLLEVGERSDDVEEEFANVLWSQGEHKTAIDLLEGISLDPRERKAAVSARLVRSFSHSIFISWYTDVYSVVIGYLDIVSSTQELERDSETIL